MTLWWQYNRNVTFQYISSPPHPHPYLQGVDLDLDLQISTDRYFNDDYSIY